MNGDGNVDGADLLLGQQQGLDAAFYTAFNAEYGTMAPNGFAAVPEPTTAVAALAVCYLSVASGYVTRRGRGR